MRKTRLMMIGLAAALVAGCDKKEDEKAATPTAMPPAAVTVSAAVTRDVPVYLDEIGKAVAMETVAVIPQVAGKVIAVHVNDGDTITKGQLLFEIDPRPFKAVLDQAKASLSQARADAVLARSESERMENALSAKAVSAMDVDAKKSAVAVADAKVEAAQAAMEAAQLNLEYTKIFSPIDGRAGARLVDAGNVVKENDSDKPLLNVQRLEPIYAEFTITENDLGTVRKYTAARGIKMDGQPERNLTVQADLPGNSERVLAALGEPAATQPEHNEAGPRTGPVTFLDNTVQQGTGTVRLRATMPNKDHYFWPGQFVNVRLVLTTKKNAVLIPVEAQQVGQQGPYVYVAKPADKGTIAEMRPITLGQRFGDLVVVDKGVEAGEDVIRTGQLLIQPGGPVQVTPGAAAPESAKADAR